MQQMSVTVFKFSFEYRRMPTWHAVVGHDAEGVMFRRLTLPYVQFAVCG